MQSSNPVFRRSEGFNGRGQTYPASGMSYPAYGTSTATDHGQTGYAPTAPVSTGPMTIDSVVQKTGITLGVLILTASATWIITGDLTGPDAQRNASTLYLLSMVGAFGGFALSMVNSFKRIISPALVIAYAALEGLFVGAFSKVIDVSFGGDGIVLNAVLGTLGAFAGTLAAYKFFNIKVGDRFRKWVVAAMFGFVAFSLLDFVLGLFNADFGFNGFGGLGLIASMVGLGLGVLMLILDFDFVERGVAAGLPERESWRAAFGLTVTLVWIYVELLRILAILRGQD